jgi:hypothetical protein
MPRLEAEAVDSKLGHYLVGGMEAIDAGWRFTVDSRELQA